MIARGDSSAPWQVSATQIKAFLGCPRKWALSYLARVPKTETAALKFGTDLHAAIALYLTDRVAWARAYPTSDGALSRLTLDMTRVVRIPEEATDLEIEPETWRLALPAECGAPPGSTVHVKPDVAWRVGAKGHTVDWKTTSATSPRSTWVLSSRRVWGDEGPPPGARSLWHDVQFRIYSLGAFRRHAELVANTGQWVYGSKRLPPGGGHAKVWSVLETVERDECEQWAAQHLWPAIAIMWRLRRAWLEGDLDSPLLVPHDGSACEHVGKFCDGLAWCQMQQSPIPKSALHLPVIPQ
jgi:hypothetical protein